MNKRLDKAYAWLILVIVLSCIILVCCQEQTNNNKGLEHKFVVEDHAFQGILYDSLEQLAGYAPHIVSGTVVDWDLLDSGVGEFVFRVDEQFKGETGSEVIHVYVPMGHFAMGQSYIIFLAKINGGYYPHPTYKLLTHDVIMRISGDDITHRSTYLDADLKLEDVRQRLYSVKDQTESIFVISDRPFVSQEPIPIEKMIEEADVIALVEPVHFINSDKYSVYADVKIDTVYRNVTELDLFNTPALMYMLPASIDLNTQYIAFLQVDKGLAYTLSVEGSMISREDEEEWEKVIQLLVDIDPM